MDNIEILKMTIYDLDSIKENLYSNFDDFWNYNIFKAELENPNSTYIVAKKNDEIIGFAGFWKAVDDVHITNIVTAKTYRKKGIASIMLEKLIELAQKEPNISSITLEVNSKNIAAKELYNKYNFSVVGLRKKYYNDIDDALIMTKLLDKKM